jgi:hypothetical protein
MTDFPARVRRYAVDRPDMPAPTMQTSAFASSESADCFGTSAFFSQIESSAPELSVIVPSREETILSSQSQHLHAANAADRRAGFLRASADCGSMLELAWWLHERRRAYES